MPQLKLNFLLTFGSIRKGFDLSSRHKIWDKVPKKRGCNHQKGKYKMLWTCRCGKLEAGPDYRTGGRQLSVAAWLSSQRTNPFGCKACHKKRCSWQMRQRVKLYMLHGCCKVCVTQITRRRQHMYVYLIIRLRISIE